MTCLETYATLRIFSRDIHSDEIGRILGIDATKLRPISSDSKYRHEREHHYWGWSSDSLVQSTNGLDHVGAVIELLRGKEQQLEHLRGTGCDIDLCCYWVSSGQGGPTLDAFSLGALANLGLEIWWDVYFGNPEDYARSAAGSTTGGA